VKDLVVIGGGGHAKVVIATARAAGYEVIGVLDEDETKHGKVILDVPITGGLDLLRNGIYERAVIAIGDNRKRQRVVHYYEGFCTWVTLIHPYSFVHSTCSIGDGTVVFAGVVIQPETVIGEHCIVNTSASVDHDCFLGDFVHIAPGVRLTGGVRVEEGAFVGAGAVVIPQRTVGEWSIVGAGSVVTKDVRPYSKVAGVPAKEIGLVDSNKEE